jgi:hypothetical protein
MDIFKNRLSPKKLTVMSNHPRKLSTIMTILLSGVLFASLFIMSCNNPPTTEGGVFIPVPKDTSALGKIDHFISTGEIEKFKKQYLPQRDSLARINPNLFIPVTEAFNKEGLIQLLKDPKNVGLKIYYGVKQGKRNEFRLIIVGVDEQGNDLYFSKGSSLAGKINQDLGGLEYGQCPPCEK